MSIYFRIYSGAADTAASAVESVYATARASTAGTSSDVAGSASLSNNFSSPNYSISQIFLVFDTTTVPAGTPTGSFSINVAGTPTFTNTYTIRFRDVSSVDNKIDGGSLAALTPRTNAAAWPTAAARVAYPIIDTSTMPRSSTFSVVLHSVGEETGTAPTGSNSFSVNLSETSGTTSDPYLDFVGGWSLVGVSSVVEITTTTPTLTEPAGVADGDLLIATIASRTSGTTTPTATGWTVLGSQNINNTTASTSGIASGAMLYRVRSGTPTLAFTLPSGISVGLGRIIAYRGQATIPHPSLYNRACHWHCWQRCIVGNC